ncbi:acyltransferase [Candidatus Bathyarchaeota archaeon]|nr:acyltransferase [Candidatus Bathyarchaeota archaeon]
MSQSEKHKIAVVQVEPRVGEKEQNLDKAMKCLREAKKMGAELIVFPELYNTGYRFQSKSEAYGLSEPVPDGPTTQKLVEFCRKEDVYVAMGINERDNYRLYDSAVFVGPEGFIDVYRKKHLFYEEHLWFQPGDRRLALHDTRIGRIGLTICYEMSFPEMARIYMLKGAEILVNPAAFVRPINAVLIQARAAENRIFVATATRYGEERGIRFVGLSMIVAPSGEILARASSDKEEIKIAEVNASDAVRAKYINEYDHLLSNRRTDIYDEYLGCKL